MRALILLLLSAVLPAQTDRPKGDVTRGKIVFENNCADCHDAYSEDVLTGPGLKGLKEGKLPDGRPATHDKLLYIINTGPAEMTPLKTGSPSRRKRMWSRSV